MPAFDSPDNINSKLTSLFAQPKIKNSTESQQRFAQLISSFLSNSPYHSELRSQTAPFYTNLAEFLWLSGRDMLNTESKIFKIFSELHYHNCRWLPNKGRVGKEFLQLITEFNSTYPKILAVNANSQSIASPSDALASQFLEKLTEYSARISSRSQALEQRQLDSHHHQSLAESAQIQIAQQFNTLFAQSRLPDWLIEFIHQRVFYDLVALQISQKNPDLLNRWLTLLEQLAWIYGGEHLTEYQQRNYVQQVYTHCPLMLESIDESLFSNFPDQAIYQSNLERLIESLMNCIKQDVEPTEWVPAKPLSNTNQLNIINSENVRANFHIEINDWFWLVTEDAFQSIKLYHQRDDNHLLYFSDYYGKHIAEYDQEKFTFLLASQSIHKIIDFEQAIAKVISQFIAGEQKRWHEQQKAAEVKVNEELQRSVTKIENEIEQIKQDILHPQPPNDQPLANSPSVSNHLPSEPAEAQRSVIKTEDEIKVFSNTLNSLPLGAWLLFKQQEETKQKLTLKLPSSDKYLFTDRLGRKMGEYRFAELVTLFSLGDLQILSSGEQFESKLESIVRGQRR